MHGPAGSARLSGCHQPWVATAVQVVGTTTQRWCLRHTTITSRCGASASLRRSPRHRAAAPPAHHDAARAAPASGGPPRTTEPCSTQRPQAAKPPCRSTGNGSKQHGRMTDDAPSCEGEETWRRSQPHNARRSSVIHAAPQETAVRTAHRQPQQEERGAPKPTAQSATAPSSQIGIMPHSRLQWMVPRTHNEARRTHRPLPLQKRQKAEPGTPSLPSHR
ncbi:hypothetical protein ECC02_006687 [Trypanosoma cruzi]|uniref:Uncharacterized protein n=1 Tax=Trypanosoma cruzi TaxID=5693 RepID=A0A7J6Y0Y3_TRYCR|nr:hypothetical protein ECC02_006687 [Trypanosoma cruzi]